MRSFLSKKHQLYSKIQRDYKVKASTFEKLKERNCKKREQESCLLLKRVLVGNEIENIQDYFDEKLEEYQKQVKEYELYVE